MTISPLAGKPAPKEMLIDPARLEREYFEPKPDLDDPGQLVRVHETSARGGLSGVSPAHFDDWRSHIQSFQISAATVRSGFILTGRDATRVIFGFRVSATYFDVLGVKPAMGRLLVLNRQVCR